MKTETLSTIAAIVRSDETTTQEHREQILIVCRSPVKPPRPVPIGIREVCALLEVHPVTIHRWVKRGVLHPIRLSPRRVRYDRNEVIRLREEGVTS